MKKVVLKKTRLKFFSVRNRKQIVLTANHRSCKILSASIFLNRFFNCFFEFDKVG